MTVQDQRPPPHDTVQPRNLRRIGLVAILAALAIAALGILQRRSHEAEVAQWTQDQAIPTVAVITPRPGAATQRLVLPGTVQAWYEAPIYARVNGYLGGHGSSLLTFGVVGGFEGGRKSYNALRLFKRLVNIGDAKSLACHPASTTHRQMTAEEQQQAGVRPEMIRLSVGIEHIDDIVADLDQALGAAKSG